MRGQQDFDRRFLAMLSADPELQELAQESRRLAAGRETRWLTAAAVLAAWCLVPLIALACGAALAAGAWVIAREAVARRRNRGKR